jgi:hypothetical protein
MRKRDVDVKEAATDGDTNEGGSNGLASRHGLDESRLPARRERALKGVVENKSTILDDGKAELRSDLSYLLDGRQQPRGGETDCFRRSYLPVWVRPGAERVVRGRGLRFRPRGGETDCFRRSYLPMWVRPGAERVVRGRGLRFRPRAEYCRHYQ